MELIYFKKKKQTFCPHCQNLTDEGEYAFGADFPIVEYDDLFYIRKTR